MSEEEARCLKEAMAGKTVFNTEELHALVMLLRSEWGCSWDRAQTHESIRKNFIEEAYEAAEAIDRRDPAMLREELGDVLFQVMFHTVLAEEEGAFTWQDVVTEVCRKMVVRHPHVFGENAANSTEEALPGWDAIKASTKEQKTPADEVDAVAKTLPALMRAQKIVKRSGFLSERPGAEAVDFASEWLSGLAENCGGEDCPDGDALGKALFFLCAYAHKTGQDAEEALTRYADAFAARLRKETEQAAAEQE